MVRLYGFCFDGFKNTMLQVDEIKHSAESLLEQLNAGEIS